ncbi:MAG TPA: tryptophan 2,3-dioxygenase family protein [Gemmatimonadota bacterium]|nr:tryptophan 2,3-dioxygenase family protein [Gemmatimonadota bacterium]
MTGDPLTYGSYLRLDELLSLQDPRSDEHDEILFIVIHQVYELWFKEILHELDFLDRRLEAGDLPMALHTLKRILTVLKIVVAQTDVLETMTPVDFTSFRDRLETASGGQSWQFREIEFALGIKDERVLLEFAEGSEARRRLETRFDQPTLWDALLRYLDRAGYEIPRAVMQRDVTTKVETSEELQRVLIDVYREDRATAELCERLVDLDEGFQEWRYRHIKMVERTIGTKRGTGGSSGVEFLKGTLWIQAFPDLWEIRGEL